MNTTQDRLRSLMTASWNMSFWPTLWRVTLGILIMAFHGAPKVLEGKMGGMIEDLTTLGWPMPTVQAFMASYIEFAGGILLILGLFTRPVAAAMVVLFAIITFVYLGQDPFIAKEKAFVFLMMSIYVFWAGPGTWSVDHFLFRKTAAPGPAAR